MKYSYTLSFALIAGMLAACGGKPKTSNKPITPIQVDRLTLQPLGVRIGGTSVKEMLQELERTILSYVVTNSGVKVPLSNVGIRFDPNQPFRSTSEPTPLDAEFVLYEVQDNTGRISLVPFLSAGATYQTVRKLRISTTNAKFIRVTPQYLWEISPLSPTLPDRVPQDLYIGSGITIQEDQIEGFQVEGGVQVEKIGLSAKRRKEIAEQFRRTFQDNSVFGRWEAPVVDPVVIEEKTIDYRPGATALFRKGLFTVTAAMNDELSFTFFRPEPFERFSHRRATILDDGKVAVHIFGVIGGGLRVRILYLDPTKMRQLGVTAKFWVKRASSGPPPPSSTRTDCKQLEGRLSEIRQRYRSDNTTECLEAGTARSTDLWDLYDRSNEWLIDLLGSMEDEIVTPRHIILAAAPAGTGKSYYFREHFGAPRRVSLGRLISIRANTDALQVDLPSTIAGDRPDLRVRSSSHHGVIGVVNSLRGGREEAQGLMRLVADYVRRMSREQDGGEEDRPELRLLILDGLDELATPAACEILSRLERPDYVEGGSLRAIVVFGRGEIFADCFASVRALIEAARDSDRMRVSIESFRVPEYRNFGEVKLRCDNYVSYRHGDVSRRCTDDETRWLKSVIEAEPDGCSLFSGGLISSGTLIKQALDAKGEPIGAVRDLLYEAFMGRNYRTHRRPTAGNIEYEESLWRAFVEAARFRAADAASNDSRSFFVGHGSRVPYGAGNYVASSRILSLSGIVDRQPVDDIMFEIYPRWLGPYITERFLRSRGCGISL